jgi:hypothetical protein
MPDLSAQTKAAAEATARWAASMRGRSQRKPYVPHKMAPWNENVYFQTPRETLLGPSSFATGSPLVPGDLYRVALIISNQQGGPAYISTLTQTIGGVGPGLGVFVNQVPVIITQADFGNLCQVEWFITSAVNVVVSVIEVRLRDWPG